MTIARSFSGAAKSGCANSKVEPTVCAPASAPALAPKFESPPYSAATECSPGVSADAVKVVTPPAPNVTGAPRLAPSTLNCTGPPGMPAPDVTVAVKVTSCPAGEVSADEVTLVLVAAFAIWNERVTSPAAL